MSKLEKKVALVTGGSRGIGAAIAKRLAADGADVAITYTKGADAAASVVKDIEKTGRKAVAIQADAADANAVKAAVDKTVKTLGRLDILVNNAGVAVPKTFEETSLDELNHLIDINVRGTFVATQEALKHMKNGGRIVMIGWRWPFTEKKRVAVSGKRSSNFSTMPCWSKTPSRAIALRRTAKLAPVPKMPGL